MNRKALFFDIDGTLLDDFSKDLPESAVRVIEEARKAGHLVFINSGRARCLMGEIENSLAVDGYLCGCGTYIEIQGRVALHHLLAEKRRFAVQKGILDYNLDGMLEGPNGCFVQQGISRMPGVEQVKKVLKRSGAFRPADWRQAPLPFDKFCVVADENSDVPGFLKTLSPDIAAIDRGHGLYECVPAGFDKATAMAFILDYFDIPWEESYAFGDSSNDLAMIRYAKNSIIMGKHDAVLEPYATFITKGVEEDGIAYAFEKLHII